MTNLNTSTEAPNTTETAIGFIPCYRLPFLSLFHADCMEIMKQYPDKYFDLAIVDPPYGIGINKGGHTLAGNGNFKGGNFKVKATKYTGGEWDNEPPNKEYFDEVFRISKNQIIWGANHFIHQMPISSSCWIVWDKDNGESFQADCELAWTSFNTAVRKFSWRWWGLLQQNMANKQKRIHPTEKPIQLYEFLIKEYSKPNFKILDTHFGSGSIALAVDKANRLDKMNLHLTACEIDKEYIDKAIKRISESIKQGTLSF
jgi:site-specific DNA-methyltransferase (adenine-specific)